MLLTLQPVKFCMADVNGKSLWHQSRHGLRAFLPTAGTNGCVLGLKVAIVDSLVIGLRDQD